MAQVLMVIIAATAQPAFPRVEMVQVPAGEFLMGKDAAEGATPNDAHEQPRHAVWLPAYEIARHEFTNAHAAVVITWAVQQGHLEQPGNDALFRLHGQPLLQVNTPGTPLVWNGTELEHPEWQQPPRLDHPLVHVSWYGAVALCNWLSMMEGRTPCYDLARWELVIRDGGGYRLPSEAEWERAAAWDAATQRHWAYALPAESLTRENANHFGWRGGGYANPAGLFAHPYTSPVGHYAQSASPVGCFDMSGNVWEWCQDWYAPDYYAASPREHPQGPATGDARTQRGGSWRSDTVYCRSAYRNRDVPQLHLNDLGFRVARSIAP
jgi:sulfatase modifying factor 1